jgi:hypothetical protein
MQPFEIKSNPPWPKSAVWLRIHAETGDLELELYDYSPQAQSSLGGDVAWIWRVPAAELPRLRTLLEQRTRCPVPGSPELLGALSLEFPGVHALRDWLRAESFAVTEEFDGSA